MAIASLPVYTLTCDRNNTCSCGVEPGSEAMPCMMVVTHNFISSWQSRPNARRLCFFKLTTAGVCKAGIEETQNSAGAIHQSLHLGVH